MQHTISYNQSAEMNNATATVTSITTSETTVFTNTDGKYSQKSQLSVYLSIALSGGNSVTVRYYHSPDFGTTWYPLPTKNYSTGQLSDLPTIIDSTTYATGGNSLAIEDIGMSGNQGLKITMTASATTATLNAVRVLVRDN